MKTLVIHPEDITTAFLSKIYEDCDYTLITRSSGKRNLKELIKSHERIIMLGHGDEKGLYGHFGHIIHSDLVYLLRDKYCICIWCNADVFVEKYDLKGLYSGMIISEVEEAMMFGINPTYHEIEYSNQLFAEQMRFCIDKDSFIDLDYDSDTNLVIQFNRKNLYKR